MPSQSGHSPRLTMRRSIRTRLVALLLGLTVIPMLAVGYLGVNSVRSVGGKAQQISAGALRDQAERYLRETTASDARTNELILEKAQSDALKLAQYASKVFANPSAFDTGAYWQAEDRMVAGDEGQYSNSQEDVASAFVPNFADFDEETLRALEMSSYMDFILGPTYESDPNTAAIYLGTEHETTYYYPNIGLGEVLPPDFQVTQRPWYVNAAPENNPERGVIWTPTYLDATGKGLMVTAAAPVYADQDAFIGVVGVDVTLQDITASVEKTRVLGSGYAFLLDGEGRAVALPERGYRDLLGRDPEPDEVGPELDETDTPFAPLLDRMIEAGTGFDTVEVGGRELFVAYTPLENTGWSMANVVEADAILEVIPALQQELGASTRSLVLRRIVPVGAAILLIVAAVGSLLAYRLTVPIREMATAVQRVGAGHWDVALPADRGDEIGILARAFDQMTDQLGELYNGLEQRVVARTRDLRQRSIQLEAASQIAREAAGIRDVEELLDETVHLISDRFGFYHAGIFLIDEPGKYAVLQAASSKGGERMLARQHRLRVAEEGIVGYVAGSGEPRVALDVGEDAVFFDNPDLPGTRSEMALPLEVRDRVIGVLDVQSVESAAFSDDDVSVLQTMADQVALAIDNARLLAEAEERIQEIHALLRSESREGWRQMTQARPGWRYVYGSGEAAPEDGKPREEDGAQLSMPLQVRDIAVGKLNLKLGDRSPTPDEQALIREVLDQASQALESARLFQETQRRAARERLVAEITAKVRASSDVEGVMRTAVRELGRVMGANRALVQLARDPTSREEGPSQGPSESDGTHG
jgi:GAF domain-containing protein/HAMP domain-containing protein